MNKSSNKTIDANGLKIDRFYTKEGVSPFDMFEYIFLEPDSNSISLRYDPWTR
jgi:hypothetical protein